RAHDCQARPSVEGCSQCDRVVEVAEYVNTRELGPVTDPTPGAASGRDDQSVIENLLPVGEQHAAPRAIELRGGNTEAPLNVQRVAREADLLDWPAIAQDLLRQRWPRVGTVL